MARVADATAAAVRSLAVQAVARSAARESPAGGAPFDTEHGRHEMVEEESQHVVVEDVRMDFWSMVTFMVKWAVASIPAAAILVTIVTLIMFLINAVATQPLY